MTHRAFTFSLQLLIWSFDVVVLSLSVFLCTRSEEITTTKFVFNMIYTNFVVNLISPDNNECQVDNGGCQQVCVNTDDSFFCSCNSGFVLKADQQTCESKHRDSF